MPGPPYRQRQLFAVVGISQIKNHFQVRAQMPVGELQERQRLIDWTSLMEFGCCCKWQC